ncbi:MAG: DUF6069 family protein, partial [Candidatus Dormibacteraceae bacterium]
MEKRRAMSAPRSSVWLRVLVVPGAVAVDLLVWILAHALAGIALEVRMAPSAPAQEVGLPSIVVISLLVGVVA